MAKPTNLEKLAQATAQLKDFLDKPESVEVVEEPAEDLTEAVSTSDETTEIETSEPSVEVKEDVNLEEEVDSKGVSYKNRFSEAERKLKQSEARAAELADRLDALSKQSADQALVSLRGASYDNTNDSTGRIASQTNQQAETPQEGYEEAPATIQDVHKVVAKLTAKERNDQEALKRYPDLYNTNSLLYKETLGRINAKARIGADRSDPFLLIETAAAAFGDLVATGKITPKPVRLTEEAARRANTDNATVLSSKTVVKTKTAPQLNKMDAFVLSQFEQQAGIKITPEQFLKRKSNAR